MAIDPEQPEQPEQPQQFDADRYATEGWAVVDGLFDPADCAAILAASARRAYPQVTAELAAWATDRRWSGPVLAAIGPDVRFLREQLVTKHPESAGTVPWHQDHAYLPTDPAPFVSCFLALTATTEANGCLWVSPGSHHRGAVDHVPAAGILRAATEVDADARPVPLAAGSVLVFSSLTLHHSGPNRSPSPRAAWIVQFCRADTVDTRTGDRFPGLPLVAERGTWQPVGADRAGAPLREGE